MRLALSFLTILPIRTEPPDLGDLGRAAMWFPFVGLVLGTILAAAHSMLSLTFQPLLVAALITALWAALTGGLHLDGLADCCDGLFAATTPERRLDIMRDPRLGSFGVIGLTLFLLLKVLALASASLGPASASLGPASASLGSASASLPLLLFAPALARWLILIVALQPPARLGGMAASFAPGLSAYVFLFAALIPIALGAFFFEPRFLIATAVAHLVTFGIILVARSRLGGVTGDVLGLTVELGELSILLAFAARRG